VYLEPMSTLESRLTALTVEFVSKLVDTLRNASFAEVAALSPAHLASPPKPRAVPAARRAHLSPGAHPSPGIEKGRGRQTAARRAELGERVLTALRKASQPTGVRALSDEIGVTPDMLAVPLRELRAAARIHKHGEKRNTTYSAV
jgi:hypothetical protein